MPCLSRTDGFNSAEIKSACSIDAIWLRARDCGSCVGMSTGWMVVGSIVVDCIGLSFGSKEEEGWAEMKTDCGTKRRQSTRPQLHIINGAGSGCDGSWY